MKFAVISDVHSNIYALEAVYKDIQERHVDQIYCTGDSIGYLTAPNKVLSFIQDHQIICILGNHDQKYLKKNEENKKELSLEVLQSKGSYYYTDHILSDENRQFINTLPEQLMLESNKKRILFVHGSPESISEYMYENDDKSKYASLADVIIFGHTHIPYHQILGSTNFINPGSVGKPKHGDNQASYVIVDVKETVTTTFVKVPYDVSALIDEIENEPWISSKLIDDLR